MHAFALKAVAAILLLAACVGSAAADGSAVDADGRCSVLLDKAVAKLAAEQYAQMLRLAEGRMLLCPEPTSAFLLGVAQANMVDSLAVADPAAHEQLRRKALHNLRVASAGAGALPSRWQLTAHEWIVHLQGLGAAAGSGVGGVEGSGGLDPSGDEYDNDPLLQDDESAALPPMHPMHKAPPPQPQPTFPWGPMVTGVLGAAALTTGIAWSVSGADKADEARKAEGHLLQLAKEGETDPAQLRTWALRTVALDEEAQSDSDWGLRLMLVGGGVLAAAGVWYWLVPPKGKWRWAAAPTSIQTTVVF